jgi:hypothetical protein
MSRKSAQSHRPILSRIAAIALATRGETSCHELRLAIAEAQGQATLLTAVHRPQAEALISPLRSRLARAEIATREARRAEAGPIGTIPATIGDLLELLRTMDPEAALHEVLDEGLRAALAQTLGALPPIQRAAPGASLSGMVAPLGFQAWNSPEAMGL